MSEAIEKRSNAGFSWWLDHSEGTLQQLAEVLSLYCCIASRCELYTEDNFKGVVYYEEVGNVVLQWVVVSRAEDGRWAMLAGVWGGVGHDVDAMFVQAKKKQECRDEMQERGAQ